MKLRKGDTVEVLTGKDKGKQGTILQVLPSEEKVIVSGVNTASKHMKPGRRHRNRQAPQQRDQGGIVEIDLPIHVSNVASSTAARPCASATAPTPRATRCASPSSAAARPR